MMRLIEQCMRFIFALAAFCSLSFAAIIYSGSADRWLSSHLSDFLTTTAGRPVHVQNAHINFPLKIVVDSMTLGSPHSPACIAEQLSIDWHVHGLLRGNFVVRALDIGSLIIYGRPEAASLAPSNSPDQSAPAKGLSINALSIRNLRFAKEMQASFSQELQAMTAASWQLQGSCQLDADAALKAAFHIQDIGQTFSAEGTLYGSIDNLDINADFKAPLLASSTISLSDIEGSLKLKTREQHYAGTLKTAASIQGVETFYSSDFTYAAGKLNASEIALKTPYGSARGHLLIALDEKWMEGRIQADLHGDAYPGTNIHGNAAVTLHFNRDHRTPHTISITSPSLQNDDIILKDVQIEAALTDLTTTPQFTVHTSIKEILFPQIPVHGLISAQGSLVGPISEPKGKFIFSLSNIVSKDERWAHHPALDGNIYLSLADGHLSCRGKMASQAIPLCAFTGEIPYNLSLIPFESAIDGQNEISGRLDVEGDLATMLQLFFPEFTMLSGNMTASGSISGSLDSPRYYAMAKIKEGGFEIGASGTVLKNLEAQLESDGKTATLTHLQATDGTAGKVQGRGGIAFNSDEHYPFSIDFDAENSVLWQQDYASATFTGQLTFSGNTLEGKLTGSAVCTEAEIVIPDSNDALVDTVEVTYINQPAGVLPPPTLIAPPVWPLAFDIDINAPGTISVVGQELESVWKGQLTFGGNTTLPMLFGDFKIVEGYYMFNGKNFSIEQGTVSMAGEVDKKTSMYVIAAKDLGKVKVEVIMKGSLKNPEISFRSNPPMSQREILSWILFNRGTSEISHFQGSQLRESITNLGSTHKGPDVLTKIRNALGIDRIEICQGGPDSDSMEVQVGKYISQNVFVSINKSDVNRLAVEAALKEHIKLQAEIGDDAEGNLMLKWKRDY